MSRPPTAEDLGLGHLSDEELTDWGYTTGGDQDHEPTRASADDLFAEQQPVNVNI